jgi:hypothetical protein
MGRSEKMTEFAYRGMCTPGEKWHFTSQETFSVGIYPVSEKGKKIGPVVVRVKGWVSQPDDVEKTANRICNALAMGDYHGPKTVDVRVGKE